MKKRIVAALMLMFSSQGYSVDLEGVKDFAPERYLGTWYEIQSTKPIFQRDCKCVKAEYSKIDETTLKVLNSCYQEDGTVRTATGTARIKDLERPSRLEVKFGPISIGGVNYVVTEIGEDYDYSVVVSPGNSPVWILSRDKVMDPALVSRLRKGLVEAGVKVGHLKEIDSTQCPDF
jgi:apolipoprotein D and lipocalin family protein